MRTAAEYVKRKKPPDRQDVAAASQLDDEKQLLASDQAQYSPRVLLTLPTEQGLGFDSSRTQAVQSAQLHAPSDGASSAPHVASVHCKSAYTSASMSTADVAAGNIPERQRHSRMAPAQAAQECSDAHTSLVNAAGPADATKQPQIDTVPAIAIDKPLPPWPGLQAETANVANIGPGFEGHVEAPQASRKPTVRRIRSFGDLLTSAQPDKANNPSLLAAPRVIERRASHFEMRSSNQSGEGDSQDNMEVLAKSQRHREHSHLTLPDTSSRDVPIEPKLIKKRSSSLGLGKAPFFGKAVRPDGTAAQESGLEAAVNSSRTVSSATAPAAFRSQAHEQLTEAGSRKRKQSVFSSLVPSFWRSKPRDTPPHQSTDNLLEPAGPSITTGRQGEVLQSLPAITSGKSETASASLDELPAAQEPAEQIGQPAINEGIPAEERQASVSLRTDKTKNNDPSPNTSTRRYSIIHALFRSTGPSSASRSEAIAPELKPSNLEEPTTSVEGLPSSPNTAPINIGHASLPQLPSIERDLAEISFGSLFDVGDKRSRARSRASTKSSLSSLLSLSPRDLSPLRSASPPVSPQILRSRSRSNSQLQQSITAADLEEGADASIAGAPNDANTASRSKPTAFAPARQTQPRTRLFRSNSASSAASTILSPHNEEVHAQLKGDKTGRPLYGRSRSSSTVHSNRSIHQSQIMPARGWLMPSPSASPQSLSPLASPAITVTDPHSVVPNADGSNTSGPRQLGIDSPVRVDTHESDKKELPATVGQSVLATDANLADAMTDFVLTPPIMPENRVSADSQRSSYSAASSILSSSPTSTLSGSLGSGRAAALIQKKFRKRANTAGSLLSYSTPPSAGAPLDAGDQFSEPSNAFRTPRSSSSSRLSSLVSSSQATIPFSTSPVDNASNWLKPRRLTDDHGSVKAMRHSTSYTSLRADGDITGTRASSPDAIMPEPNADLTFTQRVDQLGTRVKRSHDNTECSGTPVSGSSAAQASSRPNHGEKPAEYVHRLRAYLDSQDIVTALTSKSDDYHAEALDAYLAFIDLANDAIDVAIRKLLLALRLPRETQQIDRLMEGFARRYNYCNPALFASTDQPYILAFSIIMLHTDAFNRSNKSKMSKTDYVKNTRIDGLTPVLLEYIFDNICFAPFIYAEDATDLKNQSISVEAPGGTPAPSRDRNKEDLYLCISSGKMDAYRMDLATIVPSKNPFSYTGTVAFFDCSIIHKAFLYAHTMRVTTPGLSSLDFSFTPSTPEDSLSLKITRIGLLERKDDLTPGGKKSSSRKWRTWTVLLAGSQLLLFRESTIFSNITGHATSVAALHSLPQAPSDTLQLPFTLSFRPDEMLSLSDSIALYDFTYIKYPNTFRLIQPDGRQILLRASGENDLNYWMSTINYAATFRTSGIRMRSEQDWSHDEPASDVTALPLPAVGRSNLAVKGSLASSISAESTGSGPDSVYTQLHASSAQLLLPGPLEHGHPEKLFFPREISSDLMIGEPGTAMPTWYKSRGNIIRSKIAELEVMVKNEQEALALDIREVRNLAILTPVMNATRQRLEQAALPVAARVRHTRQSIAKYICYRECLSRDLLATERAIAQYRQHNSDREVEANGTTVSRALAGPSTMQRSASQDQIAHLLRSPSMLRRSLTSDPTQARDLGAMVDEIFQSFADHHVGSGASPASTSCNSPALSAASARLGQSPLLLSSTFDTVAEEDLEAVEHCANGRCP